MKRKAQSASGSAILVIVITVLIILYILFLPPDQRQELLDPNVTEIDDDERRVTGIVLREQIGRIEFLGIDERIYDLSSFTVSTGTDAQELARKSSAYTKNSVFDDERDRMNFDIRPDLTENVLLTFNIDGKPRGRLHITLNGETIFRGELSDGNSPPIYIEQSLLERQNTLEFSVSSPGFVFWRYNQYELSNIRILGDVTDISLSENIQEAILTERERENLEIARLRYTAVCDQRNVRDFEVRVNNQRIFRGIPDCNVLNTHTISREYLREGKNEFEFRIGEGQVLVDSLRFTAEMEDPDHPIYYFFLRDELFEEDNDEYILKENRNVLLELSFPNTEQKRLELFINGYLMGINTAKREDSRNINHFVRPGTNAIEIRPLQDVTITEMRVRVR